MSGYQCTVLWSRQGQAPERTVDIRREFPLPARTVVGPRDPLRFRNLSKKEKSLHQKGRKSQVRKGVDVEGPPHRSSDPRGTPRPTPSPFLRRPFRDRDPYSNKVLPLPFTSTLYELERLPTGRKGVSGSGNVSIKGTDLSKVGVGNGRKTRVESETRVSGGD